MGIGKAGGSKGYLPDASNVTEMVRAGFEV